MWQTSTLKVIVYSHTCPRCVVRLIWVCEDAGNFGSVRQDLHAFWSVVVQGGLPVACGNCLPFPSKYHHDIFRLGIPYKSLHRATA